MAVPAQDGARGAGEGVKANRITQCVVSKAGRKKASVCIRVRKISGDSPWRGGSPITWANEELRRAKLIRDRPHLEPGVSAQKRPGRRRAAIPDIRSSLGAWRDPRISTSMIAGPFLKRAANLAQVIEARSLLRSGPACGEPGQRYRRQQRQRSQHRYQFKTGESWF